MAKLDVKKQVIKARSDGVAEIVRSVIEYDGRIVIPYVLDVNISDEIEEDMYRFLEDGKHEAYRRYIEFINRCISRYRVGDFGELSVEDTMRNYDIIADAIQNGEFFIAGDYIVVFPRKSIVGKYRIPQEIAKLVRSEYIALVSDIKYYKHGEDYKFIQRIVYVMYPVTEEKLKRWK